MGLVLRLLIAVGLLLAGPASAQDLQKNPFRVEVTDLTLAPGASGNVAVSVIVPREYHVYRDMMHVKVLDAHGLTVGEPNFPPGRNLPDPSNPAQTREMYDMDVVEQLIRQESNFSRVLWGLLQLELWHREFLDTGSTRSLGVIHAA